MILVEQEQRSPSLPDTIPLFVIAAVRLYREGLGLVLDRSTRIDVAGMFASAEEATSAVRAASSAVVLLDAVPAWREHEISCVRSANPAVKVVALGVPDVESEIVAWAEAGVAGFVSDQSSLDDLVLAVGDAASGVLHCSPRVAGVLLRRIGESVADAASDGTDWDLLTRRESEIIRLVGAGLSNKEISRSLHIALPTVKNHIHNILQKLQASSRSEALSRLRSSGQRRAFAG